MFQSTIIVDPKSEIKGKQGSNVYIVKPIVIDRRESIRVKDVQDMLNWCSKSAFEGNHKVVVVEELHKASDAVPHALLKLLEEPPPDTQVTITIDRAESTLATIRSRCAIVTAHEIDAAEMAQLGLQRTQVSQIAAPISWQEFMTKSYESRMEWLASFVKGKRDSQSLIDSWQSEIADIINSQGPLDRPKAIQQLALLEEIGTALRQNVLPRLALQYLNIQLQHC